ncbi:inactive protein RESTRICTED TEV MOVEMENT 2 [Manihot esculenta]|uniref:SHSP domain-containing protein n=1 Tax=Manihot esculenta TaxID=3983 RepID=A0A2C9V5B3_MANES|nr:inactive protein RESTRICTED TEV MOVEMENT 2 [Manihot esculenta]OAY39141.1 hypothetical protein MANES_10G070600v8 [Manihot esculenta]
MATRTRTGGSNTIQYEDFKPKSEMKEEAAAHVLLVHLPAAFQREQVKITYERSTRLIRVVGERPIGGNKWSRINEAFPVPQNCDVQKIQAKFENRVFTITMPKLAITQPQKPAFTSTGEEPKQKKATSQMPQEAKTDEKMQKGMEGTETQKQTVGKQVETAVSPGEAAKDIPKSKTQDENTETHKQTVGKQVESAVIPGETVKDIPKSKTEDGDTETHKQTVGKQVESAVSPGEAAKDIPKSKTQDENTETHKQTVGKQVESAVIPGETVKDIPKSETEDGDTETHKQTVGKQVESAVSPGEAVKDIPKSKTRDEATSKEEKHTENREGYEKTMETKQEETDKKRKGNLLADESVERSKKRKEAAVRSSEKEKGGKLEFIAEKVKEVKNVAAAAKKSVMELSEERQSLVKIGVAVLAIAALGAYISYTYRHRSSGNSKD